MSNQIVRHAASKAESKNVSYKKRINNLDSVLICDTETTSDFSQKFKIAGFNIYSLKKSKSLIKGIVIDKDALSEKEIENINIYGERNNLEIVDRFTFVDEWLYALLFKGIPYANHNIKFDIGSFCTSWNYHDKNTIRMLLCDCSKDRGLSVSNVNCPFHPPIMITHLPSGKYLFSIDTEEEIGSIIDTMQLGKALMGASCPSSLIDMGNTFKCKTVKFISEEHGMEIEDSYLNYTMNDVEATTELYIKQVELYLNYDIDIPLASIVSEASVGKGMYSKIGFTPILKNHNIPVWYERIAAKAYYGGRSEVVHRAYPIQIAYLDFMSQYPFSVAWLGLQDIQMAKTLTAIHCTSKVVNFLKNFKIQDLQKKDVGKQLRIFVKIKPDMDILPIKAKLEGDNYTIVRNTYIIGPENWYTLLDVLGSYIRTKKLPEIIDAVELIPTGKMQVNTIKFFGNDNYIIDANTQDFAASLIDVRSDVKKQRSLHKKGSDEYTNLDTMQNALKLIANSTSYGMYCETREVEGHDVLGKYACYSIGSLIPACGRFLLSVVEALANEKGIKYVACDTDSMMLAKPDNLSYEEFMKKIEEIQDFFKPMSVFKSSNDILELEEVNGNNPLWFIGISSKRYAVYHKLNDETYHIRKATVNGVGYINFNKDIDTIFPIDIPKPFIFIKNEKGIYEKKFTEYAQIGKQLTAWQYILWYRAIQQFEQGISNIKIPVEEWNLQVVRRHVSLSSPHVMKCNRYIPNIRPFGFFTQLSSNKKGVNYSSHFNGSSKDILNNTIYDSKTHKINDNPHYKKLYEQFESYFIYCEKKVVDGNLVGWLEKRVAHIEKVIDTTRKGKEIIGRTSIFDILEEL